MEVTPDILLLDMVSIFPVNDCMIDNGISEVNEGTVEDNKDVIVLDVV